MRRKQNEIIDKRIIEEILQHSQVCRIAMLDGGRPYIVPLNYGYKDGALYFHSAPLGKKIDLLKKNNQVCFEVEYYAEIVKREQVCDWGTKYRSVIGYGSVCFIAGFEEKKRCLDIIMAHYGKTDKNEYNDKQVERVALFKLNIEEITGKQLGDWG